MTTEKKLIGIGCILFGISCLFAGFYNFILDPVLGTLFGYGYIVVGGFYLLLID